MRAIVRQRCMVCPTMTSSKAEMEEHIEEAHGNNWQPAEMKRSKNQMEFRAPSSNSPWGRELR